MRDTLGMTAAVHASARPRHKDLSIESLRGLACLLIVAYHAIPVADAVEGLINYGYLGHCFRLIRLPLFTAISGYVYAMHALAPGEFGRFMTGKSRRILLPWVSVTLLTLGLRSVLQKSGLGVDEVLRSLWLPIDHLWFLPAIFWVFLATALLESTGCLRSLRAWLLTCAVSWLGATFLLGTFLFAGLPGFFQLLPFFLFGLGLFRFRAALSTPLAIRVYAVTAVVGLTIHQLMWFGLAHLSSTEYNLLVLFTVYGTQGLLFRYRRNVPALASLGRWSFAIYLFHPMAISIAARLAAGLHLTNIHALFALKIALGLTLPVALALVVRRVSWLNLVLLGERSPRRAGAVSGDAAATRT
jgi:peptidoglycan/LPS O-acetylase OafA/YrhL